jgi:hypothetical protein
MSMEAAAATAPHSSRGNRYPSQDRWPYLNAHTDEMAWREDHRRLHNGEQYLALATAAARPPVSRQWKGCWQRQRRAA